MRCGGAAGPVSTQTVASEAPPNFVWVTKGSPAASWDQCLAQLIASVNRLSNGGLSNGTGRGVERSVRPGVRARVEDLFGPPRAWIAGVTSGGRWVNTRKRARNGAQGVASRESRTGF
jgi:hypothetical protein